MNFRLVHEDLLEHPVLRGTGANRTAFSKAEAFIWLIQKAYRKSAIVAVEGGEITLDEGELCQSYRFMADIWGWSVGKVQGFIKRLQRNAMVNTRVDRNRLVLSLCNFRKYQSPTKGLDTPVNTVEKPDSIRSQYEQQQGNNKEEREMANAISSAPQRGRAAKARRPDAERRGYLGTDDALDGQLALPGVAELPICSPAPLPEPLPESTHHQLEPVSVSVPAPTATQAPPAEVVCITKQRAAKIKRDAAFAEWYAGYPIKHDPGDAERQYFAALKRGATHAELIAGASRYAAYCAARGTERDRIKYPANWLRADAWKNEYPLPTTTVGEPSHGHQPNNRYAKPVTGGDATAALSRRFAEYRARNA
jgi:hypothetical protein